MESPCILSHLTLDHVSTTGHTLTLHTREGAALRISSFGDGVCQLWLDPAATFEKPVSFAIPDENPHGALTMVETDAALLVRSGRLTLHIGKSPISLRATLGDAPLFTLAQDGMVIREDGSFTCDVSLAEGEHILGLGEDNDARHGALDRRGTVRDMLTGQTITSGCVTADMPVTFYMSSAGYGLYMDNSFRARIDVGAAQQDVLSMSFEGGELLLYIMAGPEFEQILSHYTDLTGKPSLPPLWTQGYIQSKCTYRTWEEIEEMLARMKEERFPLDGYVIDADWPSEYVSFEFDERWKGQSPEKIRALKEQGYKLMLSTSGPMIKKDCKLYQSGVDADIFVTDGKGNTVTCGWYGGELMDFSSPKMHDWIKPLLTRLLEMGVDAWWLDLIEPEGDPLQSVYQGGSRARIHNAFALLNTRLYYEITKEFNPDCRPFILGRTATAGIQKYGSSTWTGDVYCDWDTLQAHCPEALNAALSGIPNWTCDTGGFITESLDNALGLPSHYYRNDPAAHAMLFARWWQLSCFAPITRAHHVGPCEPYAHGEEIASICKRYIRLRYRLLPYIYTYAHQATECGMGVMRALPYAFRQDEHAYAQKDEFLFGDWLLIAPVLTEYATAREVYFPEGTWYDLDYRYRYDGPCTATVYAPLDRIPVFIRAGAIIPTMPDMLRSDEKAWDPITVHVFPQGDTQFTAYLDDGRTTAYTQGDFTLTTYTCHEEARRLLLTISPSNRRFVPTCYRMAIHMKQAPQDVPGFTRVDRLYELETGCWFFEKLTSILYIMAVTPSENETLTLEVLLEERTLYQAPAPELDAGQGGLARHEEKRTQTRLPYLLPPASLPGKIQLQNYDRGGEQVAYHMLTPGNAGGLFREDDVNISLSTDAGGGYQLSDIRGGEWLCYTVCVEQAGIYRVALRVANEKSEASFHVYFDGRDLTGKLTIPCTGSKSAWITVPCDNIDLKQGEQVIRLFISDGEVQLRELELTKMR